MDVYIQNDNLLTVDELKENITGTWLNAATVTARMLDHDKNEVGGQAWPLALVYVALSNGKYRAVLEEELLLAHGDGYTIEINVDAGSDRKAKWSIPVDALRRVA